MSSHAEEREMDREAPVYRCKAHRYLNDHLKSSIIMGDKTGNWKVLPRKESDFNMVYVEGKYPRNEKVDVVIEDAFYEGKFFVRVYDGRDDEGYYQFETKSLLKVAIFLDGTFN